MLFVAGPDALEDLDGLLDGGLLDHDRLEAAFEGGIALDVLAVLVERGRANALELSAGERGLQDVGRIDGAFGRSGPNEHVQLIDEQDAVAGALDLLDDLLEALFELAAVFGAGDERPDIEGEQALPLERLGDISRDDALSEEFGDGRLPNARFADEHGVVLGPARKDLDDAFQLVRTADNGVELSVPGGGGEVNPELVHRGRAGGLAGAGTSAGSLRGRLAEDAGGFGADALEVDAEAFEDAGRDAFAFADESQEQVLGADVAVVEAAGLIDGELDDLLRSWREADLAEDGAVATSNDELDRGADLVQLHAQVGKHLGGDAIAFAHQSEEDVLGADIVVVEAVGFFLCERQHAACALGELVEPIGHVPSPTLWVRPKND